MNLRLQRHAPWAALWIVLSLAGGALITQWRLSQLHERFEADVAIAYRLLSERSLQHETVLSTLALVRPGGAAGDARVGTTYPHILSVLRRGPDAQWPEPALQAAEAESRKRRQPVLVDANFTKGRYQLLLAGEPASYSLLIDMRSMVPWNQWPMPPDASPVQLALVHGAEVFTLQPGAAGNDRGGSWRFQSNQRLAAASQPFDVVAERRVGWDELPWATMLSWSLLVAVVLLATRALLRQRTDRQRAEALLRLGQVARINTLGELASGIAGELDQRLGDMRATTAAANRVLQEDPPDLLTAQLAVQQVAEQSQHASELLQRLQHAVEQPDLRARAQAVDLRDAARSALHLLEPELRRHSVDPEVVRSGPVFRVLAEPIALEQILHNLLLNALQALEEVPVHERRLVLEVGTSGDMGELTVRDSGPGMDAATLPHVFEPFFTTRAGSLGLGLSQSASLAGSMGGALLASNRSPRGAEFCLRLPLA